ncbi:MAG: tRNA (guanosine(37)-N1)-methyltransferase TrmD [Fibrobacterota bacterium]
MIFDILTLFPDMFSGVFGESIIKRAQERSLIDISTVDIRDYCRDKHRKADDYPYGGGPGLLMKAEPLARCIDEVRTARASHNPEVIFLSPRGTPFTHDVAEQLSQKSSLILLCGHYKGIDERIRQEYIDREISLGDFVLSGGEIAAMAVVDAVSRLIPGVLGNAQSAEADSHYNGLLSPPAYTRPEVFEGMCVPPVLLSGHHKKIAAWEREKSEEITRKCRPDLWAAYTNGNNNGGFQNG